MVDKNVFHNDSLQLFNETVFEGILTQDCVDTSKKALKIGDNKYYGYFIRKNKITYFIEDFSDNDESILDVFPILITKKTETDYNKNVFFFIDDFDSVKIPDTKQMSFRELVDTMAPFKHTNKEHWTLYKIIMIVSWVNRINFRIIAERGFGKDSMINNVNDLVGQVANIYGATFAKLEYSLKNKVLIFNEMGNLKGDDKSNLQQFLLAIGAFFNKYSKRSRATEDTLEDYDLSKQSLGIIYNPPMYYVERGQEWFDTIFTKAVHSRFIPFYLDGVLDEKFDAEFNVKDIVDEHNPLYKDCISTLMFYQKNPLPATEHELLDDIEFDERTRRFERSFLKICDYISEYAEGDIEMYYTMINSLYQAYKMFDSVLAEAMLKRGNQ